MQQEGQELYRLMERGGIHRDIAGTTPREVIENLVACIKLPAAVQKETLLSAVLEREELMSTAFGRGIALPHPRNPQITLAEDQFVAVAFLQQGVDWSALDAAPVTTAILIVSASPKLHLHNLSRLNFFCRENHFRTLLASRAPDTEILSYIKTTESAWK